MGILKDSKPQETPGSAKRRSQQLDFANLGPLKPGGTVGFLNFRDNTEGRKKDKKKSKAMADDDDMDSDEDEDDRILNQADEEEDKDKDNQHLSPDDIKRQGELAEGLRQIKVRLHIHLFEVSQLTCISLNVNTRPHRSLGALGGRVPIQQGLLRHRRLSPRPLQRQHQHLQGPPVQHQKHNSSRIRSTENSLAVH